MNSLKLAAVNISAVIHFWIKILSSFEKNILIKMQKIYQLLYTFNVEYLNRLTFKPQIN